MRTPEVYRILGTLLAVLSVASAVGYGLKLRYPNNARIDDLNARIRPWWVLIPVGGAALLAGPLFVIGLFAFLSAVAVREFVSDSAMRRVCYVAVAAQYGALAMGWVALLPELAVLGVAGLLAGRWRVAVWGVALCVCCIAHVPALMMLQIPGYAGRAPLLALFVVLIAQASDVLQYIWGKLAGRHRIAPVISPAKTVEGLVGAMVSTAVIGALLAPVTPFAGWQAGLVAVMITGLGFLGGLLMSAIKRGRGIKDWGSLIAGHGGVLDRIDSLCFSAPAVYYLVRFFFGGATG